MKCSLLFLFIPILAFGEVSKEAIEKKINREFNIKSDGYLSIDNRYGSIDIAIGESNRIRMDISITVESSNKKKAEETIDRINVKFEEGTNRVSAITEIESTTGWMSWFQTGNVEIKINYQVLVPADIYLELINKYGDIYVETTNRDLRVDIGYGDIRFGDINAKLSLKMAYSEGALSKINNGDFLLSYSDLEMEDAQSLNLDIKYTDLIMGSAMRLKLVSAYSDIRGIDIDELLYTGKYDDLVIERVKTIDAESSYSGMELGGLDQSGNFSMRYGELQVGNIGRNFTRVNINTSYTGVELAFVEGASFSVDAQNNYCDIQHHGLKVTEDIQRSSSTTLKATKGSGGGQVIVRMNYGELSIE